MSQQLRSMYTTLYAKRMQALYSEFLSEFMDFDTEHVAESRALAVAEMRKAEEFRPENHEDYQPA